MRDDYDKIICERPRRGHEDSYKLVRARQNRVRTDDADREGLPFHESMGRPHRIGKEFSDNLRPLFRWIEKQVGRPWDKVMSDLHQRLDPRKTTDRHVFQHIHWYAPTNCFWLDGKPHFYLVGDLYPIPKGGLFVDADGILKRWKQREKRPRSTWRNPNNVASDRYMFKPGAQIETHTFKDGAWWLRTLLWVEGVSATYGAILQTHVVDATHTWYLYEVSRRPLGKNEVKRHALQADAA